MLDLNRLTQTVQQNCHISDAFHAGNYSMCTFLMKMREYYRWENNIPLSEPLAKNEIGQWLINREMTWESITDNNPAAQYTTLQLDTRDADPFDVSLINNSLLEQGQIYSSGCGIFSKPHFFIGKLKKQETYDGYNLYISSREYARDLTAPPAMLQGTNIYIRQESIRRFVWEKIEEWQWKKNPDAPVARMMKDLGHATGDNKITETILDRIVENETQTMILHEMGEIQAGKMLGPQWEHMLLSLAGTKSELLVRAARDLLADSLVTVPKLIEHKQWASLHFYFANFSGMRKSLFPEAHTAYQQWVETGNTGNLHETFSKGIDTWHDKTKKVLSCYSEEKNRLENIIESCLNPDS